MDADPNKTVAGPVVVYDGDCPFCSAFVRMTRLRATLGPVELVDARSDHPAVAEVRAQGLDLDEGMAVKYLGRIYHGDEAMTMLASLSTPSPVFNRLMRGLFSRPRMARIIYPWLVRGRNMTLFLLGRRKLRRGETAR